MDTHVVSCDCRGGVSPSVVVIIVVVSGGGGSKLMFILCLSVVFVVCHFHLMSLDITALASSEYYCMFCGGGKVTTTLLQATHLLTPHFADFYSQSVYIAVNRWTVFQVIKRTNRFHSFLACAVLLHRMTL